MSFIKWLTAALVALAALVAAADSVYEKISKAAVTKAVLQAVSARKETSKFKMSLSAGSDIENPSEHDIRNAIALIAIGKEEFIVLNRGNDSNEFMQSAKDNNGKFLLEYRVRLGSGYGLFVCGDPLAQQDVTDTLIAYSRDSDAWTRACDWRRHEKF